MARSQCCWLLLAGLALASTAFAQNPRLALRFIDYELLPHSVVAPGIGTSAFTHAFPGSLVEYYPPPTGCQTVVTGNYRIQTNAGAVDSMFTLGGPWLTPTPPLPHLYQRSLAQRLGLAQGGHSFACGARTRALVVPTASGPAAGGVVVHAHVRQYAQARSSAGYARTHVAIERPNAPWFRRTLYASTGESWLHDLVFVFDAEVGDTFDIETRSDFSCTIGGTGQYADAYTEVRLTPSPAIVKVPLGGSVVSTLDPGQYRVYVPTRWGGVLTLDTDRGAISKLTTPQGVDVGVPLSSPLTYTVPHGAHGWYTFDVAGTGGVSHVVSTRFEQTGTASSVPWDYWYYPLVDAADPNLYDGTLAKFDSLFGLFGAAQAWETLDCASQCMAPGSVGHRSTAQPGWAGHCHGAVIASILLEQPRATLGFSDDELEGLAAEYFGGQVVKGVEIADPRKGELATAAATDAIDASVHRFHDFFRGLLKDQAVPFSMTLRQHDGPQMWRKVRGQYQPQPPQVWNQACYSYTAELREDPAAIGDPETETIRQIQVVNRFTTNNDYAPPSDASAPSSPGPLRFATEYLLLYGTSGEVLEDGVLSTGSGAQVRQNWRSFTVDPPVASPEPPDRFVPWLLADVRPAARAFAAQVPPATTSNPEVRADRLAWLGLSLRSEFRVPVARTAVAAPARSETGASARALARWPRWRVGDRWRVQYSYQLPVPIKAVAAITTTAVNSVYEYLVESISADDNPRTPPLADVRVTSQDGFGDWRLTFDLDRMALVRARVLDAAGTVIAAHDNPFAARSWMWCGDPLGRGLILDFPELSSAPQTTVLTPRLTGTPAFQQQLTYGAGQPRPLTARFSRTHPLSGSVTTTTIDWLEGDAWWSRATIAVDGTAVITGTRLP